MNALDAEAIRSIRGAVPDVRPAPKWIDDNQALPCVLLGLVIACEFGFLFWCLFFRR